MAMNAPLLPTQMRPMDPVRKPTALMAPPRPWTRLSETVKTQLASIIAEMVKRKAAPREDQSDAGDHDCP
jgi:hypothetical protein